MTKIHVNEPHLSIIKQILSQYPYEFFAFGSRVNGKHKHLSDLDIMIKDDISGSTLEKIRGDFEDSNIPFKIDIVLYKDISPEFYHRIKSDLRKIHPQ
ncbi:MAG: hypothetical protein A4S09_06210 [Proteobacteria bacterium SG_bin7]|nr:MAG: hypothetical protein A4S09_06210 [Proteobacteria bacterium SG_bin7]